MKGLLPVRVGCLRFSSLLLLPSGLAAQTYPVGTIDGPAANLRIGKVVANAGDVDGDGVQDFLLGGDQIARVHSGATGAVVHSLTPPGSPFDYGASVAGIGDVDGDGLSDFAVGAPSTSVTLLAEGRVLVHSGSTGAVLYTLFGGQMGAFLGTSLAGAGDANLDGVPDLLAGGNNLVRLFSGADGSVLLSVAFAGAGSFGRAVAGVGDLDSDGAADFAVGQPGLFFSPSGGLPGPVTLRSGASGAVLQTIPPPAVGPTGDFGTALAAAGDLDADGVPDLIVGDSQANIGPCCVVGPGLARVYSGASAGLLFTFAGDAFGDALGCSVAGPGDLDGDGVPDVLAGARQFPASLGAGYARAFSGATGSPLLTMNGAGASDLFGIALSPAGDANGDGVPDFIVGAPGADPGGMGNAGQARVLSFVGVPTGGATLGNGCAGTGGLVPRIAISGGTPDSAGNPAIAVHLSNARPSAPAVWIVGFSSTSWLGIPLPADLAVLSMPGCFLNVSADVLIPASTTPAGRASFPHPTPADPALSGLTVFYQWFVVDPGPAILSGVTTAGLQIVIG